MNSLKFLVNSGSFCLTKGPQFCRQIPCLQIHIRNQSTHSPESRSGEKSTETELNLNLKADRSADQLVYAGPDTVVKMIKMIKRFSLGTTLIAAGVQPFIFQQILATNSSSFAIGFAVMTSGGVVVSPLILNWLTKRYITDLYYNYETQLFTAWYLNLLCRRVCIQYRASDVSIPEALGMFTTFAIGPKKRPFFVDPESVTDFNAYKLMLGYDKPLDLKLDQILDTDPQNVDKTK